MVILVCNCKVWLEIIHRTYLSVTASTKSIAFLAYYMFIQKLNICNHKVHISLECDNSSYFDNFLLDCSSGVIEFVII